MRRILSLTAAAATLGLAAAVCPGSAAGEHAVVAETPPPKPGPADEFKIVGGWWLDQISVCSAISPPIHDIHLALAHEDGFMTFDIIDNGKDGPTHHLTLEIDDHRQDFNLDLDDAGASEDLDAYSKARKLDEGSLAGLRHGHRLRVFTDGELRLAVRPLPAKTAKVLDLILACAKTGRWPFDKDHDR